MSPRATGRMVAHVPHHTSHTKEREPTIFRSPYIWDIVSNNNRARYWCYECSAEHKWGMPHLNPVRQVSP